MEVTVYNTLTRSKEPLKTVEQGKAGMYSCGPTVYRFAHIGNMRTYLFTDTVRRVLEYVGFDVKHVMNVTDVGHLASDADEGPDKILEAARKERKSPLELARYYEQAFFRDVDSLNVLRPHIVSRATDHIAEMIELVKQLMDKGYAYQTPDGIYFDVARFSGYGQLSRANLEGQQAGARVEVNPHKRNPVDFALWKAAGPEHSMWWDTPWGRGYPGWHIECSAMAMKYLGEEIDIHTGGIDHIPIHHENEIAQADACVGHRVVNYWLHGEFLSMGEDKMSKSLGNVLLLTDLVERGYPPLVFRYLCLNSHYRKRAAFSWKALDGAAAGLANLRRLVSDLPAGDDEVPGALREPFVSAVVDDFNMPRALAALWEGLRDDSVSPGARRALAMDADRVLGLGLDASGSEVSGSIARARLLAGQLPLVEGMTAREVELIADREQARWNRDWARADSIRDQLAEAGISLEDGPENVRWTRE